MANVAKFDIVQCGHVCAHFERSVEPGHYSNEDIDSTRTGLNKNLCEAPRPGQVEYIHEMLDRIPHAKRKDLKCMCSVIVDAPSTLDNDQHDRFFQLTYDFLVDRYGSISGFENKEDIVISCYRHKDESTDHIHFAFCPIKADKEGNQRFICKEVICRDDLRTLHQDLSNYLRDHHCRAEVLNGKTQRDSTGRALSVREMKYRDAHRIDRADRGRGRF